MKIKNWRWLRLAAVLILLLVPVATFAQDDIQDRFDAAMSAIEDDRLTTAREILVDLLEDYPNLQRARLELARVHYLTYDLDGAERLAREVLEDPNTPVSVQTTVLAFLAQIREDRKRLGDRHIWGASLYVGALYDTNVNFGPSRDIFDVGGIPIIIDPDSAETSDWAWVINPVGTHTFNPGKRYDAGEDTGLFAWQSLAGFYYRGYLEEDDFDFGVLTLRTGPVWVVPEKWRATIGFQGDQIWLGQENLALFLSVNPAFSWQAGKNTELVLDTYLTDRDYAQRKDRARDGLFASGLLAVNHALGKGSLMLQGGAGYRNFDAERNRFTYKGPEAYAGVFWGAWTSGSVSARFGYRKFDFKGIEPLFNETRNDDEYRYSLAAQHVFGAGWLRDWVLSADWVFTDNRSRVPIYDFERHEVNFGLSRSF